MQATRRFCSLILAATVLGGIVLGGVATATAEDDQQARRNAAMKLYQDGNYKEAYDAFRKMALDPKHVLRSAGEELYLAKDCLQRLNRIDEADELLEAVVDVHQENWRKLAAVARTYMNVEHRGYIVAGEFRRGRKRGGQGGQMVSATERDRIRALQLMVQAKAAALEDDNHVEVAGYLMSFGEFLLNNRGWSEAWRLQYKSDLSVLPDYQGFGAGRALIAAVEEAARTQGLARVIVATSNDDLPALYLYQRCGFRLTGVAVEHLVEHHGGEEPGFAGIPVRDEIQLEKHL